MTRFVSALSALGVIAMLAMPSAGIAQRDHDGTNSRETARERNRDRVREVDRDDNLPGARADTTFVLARNALVDITLRRGTLVVRGSNRSEAELRTGTGSYTLKSSGSGVVLGVREASGRTFTRDTEDSRVELLVPRSVRVVISAGSADVDIRDIDGDVEVRSSNGDVVLERLGSRAIVESLSGDIRLTGGVGDLRVTTSSGDVVAYDVRGTVDVQSTSGDLSVTGTRVPRLRIESISGDAEFEGSVTSDARVQISTHSGDVLLRLPAGTRGSLEFETHTGEMQTNTPITTTSTLADGRTGKSRSGQRYEFGGGGSVSVVISTFNGDVRFERGSSRSSDR